MRYSYFYSHNIPYRIVVLDNYFEQRTCCRHIYMIHLGIVCPKNYKELAIKFFKYKVFYKG